MSKFTGLKKGIVGVCAATLLTGMVAVPAFAAATDQEVATPVTLDTTSVNISVTVPTAPVAIIVDEKGTFTDANGGNIENKSLCGIKISNIAVEKTAASKMTLQAVSAFDTANNATKNIAKLNAAIGSVTLDMSDYAAANGKAPTTAISLATNATQALKFSGAVKNLTAETMNEGALAFVTINWTVAADTDTAA